MPKFKNSKKSENQLNKIHRLCDLNPFIRNLNPLIRSLNFLLTKNDYVDF